VPQLTDQSGADRGRNPAARGWGGTPFWRAQAALWSCILLLGLLNRALFFQDAGQALGLTLVLEPLAFAISCLLRLAYDRLRLAGSRAGRVIGWMTLLSVVAALAQGLAAFLLRRVAGWAAPEVGALEGATIPFVYYVPIFFGWSLAYLWIGAELASRAARQRAAAAELEALRADLARLRSQLDPHFLFNALNGIAAAIPDEPRAAEAMVAELSDYLRYSLDHLERSVTSLAGEIDALQAYLRIQQARFGERLRFRVGVTPAARDRPLPAFLLQPLVENAVKHGLTGAGAIDIAVEAELVGERLQVRVQNPGRLAADWAGRGSPGVGLANLRRRLALHYPERHAFALTQRGERVSAELSLEGAPCAA